MRRYVGAGGRVAGWLAGLYPSCWHRQLGLGLGLSYRCMLMITRQLSLLRPLRRYIILVSIQEVKFRFRDGVGIVL